MAPETALHHWFIRSIEQYAPASQREARQQLYAELQALQPAAAEGLTDDVPLFILVQIAAAQTLATPKATGPRERGQAHATWYAKERQRVAKLLGQIAESPVVATFQSTLTYYDAADVTCIHGRNQKTCEELYALRVTLTLLEQPQAARLVRKPLERLRQREPYLPELDDLCAPVPPGAEEADAPASTQEVDETASYLLGTIVSRLRQLGFSVSQSCGLVDRILTCCFGRLDPQGTRPVLFAEHWRRWNHAPIGA